MKKKLLCISLASVMALSAGLLAACAEEEGTPPQEEGGLRPVSELYPNAEEFDFQPLYDRNNNTIPEYGTHDPVMVEAFKEDGTPVYYAFSTDNATGGIYGVQVRTSPDMIEWTKVGAAINGFDGVQNDTQMRQKVTSADCELKEVYTFIQSQPDWSVPNRGPCYTLWAPDVIPAPTNTEAKENGGWWMYSCWTAGFGSEQSAIFKLHADNVAGPYYYDGFIVRECTDDRGINEIDPSAYWSADGTKLYLSYGSFFSGFASVELDPTTGLRKSGETADMPGKALLSGGTDAEGSAIAYHEVDVYTGDIGAEAEDASKWEKQGKYYMMASDGALAFNYSMRTWTSDQPDEGFDSLRGASGLQIGGNWTWRHEGDDDVKDLNYYIPGHNDMLTTKDGRNLIIYHTRVATSIKEGHPSFAEGEHFLYTSLFDFNSKGQIVINPNRYAGERIGLVTKEDITSKTNGKYSVIKMQSSDVAYNTRSEIYYAQDCEFHADGTITGAIEGTWKLYGTHYIYIKLGDVEYYGTAMPALIRQYDATKTPDRPVRWKANGGLTISAITDTLDANGDNGILYLNMQF